MIKPLKAPKALRVIGGILAVLLAIALSINIYIICVVGSLQQVTTPDSIAEMFTVDAIKTVDIGSMIAEKEITLGENTVVVEDGDTAGDIAGKVVGSFAGREINSEQIDRILEQSGMSEFVGDKINEYLAVFTGSAESASISADELKQLLVNAKDVVKDTIGYEITDQDIEAVNTLFENEQEPEILTINSDDVQKIIGEGTEIGSQESAISSLWAGVLGLFSAEFMRSCIITAVITAVIIFVCYIFRFDSALTAYGYAALVAGIFAGLLPLIIKGLGNMQLEGMTSFIKVLATKMDAFIISAAIAFGVGLVLIIAGKIIKKFTVVE